MSTTTYKTIRHTTVSLVKPQPFNNQPQGTNGRFLPKAKPADIITPPKPAAKRVAKLEIVGDDERKSEVVLIDGIMPRHLAELLLNIVNSWQA